MHVLNNLGTAETEPATPRRGADAEREPGPDPPATSTSTRPGPSPTWPSSRCASTGTRRRPAASPTGWTTASSATSTRGASTCAAGTPSNLLDGGDPARPCGGRPGAAQPPRRGGQPHRPADRARAGPGWTGGGDWRDAARRGAALADRTGEVQRVSLVAGRRARSAWIRRAEDVARRRDGVGRWRGPTATRGPEGEVGTWLPAEIARDARTSPGRRTPPRSPVTGGGRPAWGELGSPFARALALARGGTRDGLAEAALAFDELGAEAAAARARALSRAQGWAPPRSKRRDTRAHPDGLTRREAEVLELLVEGLADAAIAERLVLSATYRRAPRRLDPRQARRRRRHVWRSPLTNCSCAISSWSVPRRLARAMPRRWRRLASVKATNAAQARP